jgi:hypothetical protein
MIPGVERIPMLVCSLLHVSPRHSTWHVSEPRGGSINRQWSACPLLTGQTKLKLSIKLKFTQLTSGLSQSHPIRTQQNYNSTAVQQFRSATPQALRTQLAKQPRDTMTTLHCTLHTPRHHWTPQLCNITPNKAEQ